MNKPVSLLMGMLFSAVILTAQSPAERIDQMDKELLQKEQGIFGLTKPLQTERNAVLPGSFEGGLKSVNQMKAEEEKRQKIKNYILQFLEFQDNLRGKIMI